MPQSAPARDDRAAERAGVALAATETLDAHWSMSCPDEGEHVRVESVGLVWASPWLPPS